MVTGSYLGHSGSAQLDIIGHLGTGKYSRKGYGGVVCAHVPYQGAGDGEGSEPDQLRPTPA